LDKLGCAKVGVDVLSKLKPVSKNETCKALQDGGLVNLSAFGCAQVEASVLADGSQSSGSKDGTCSAKKICSVIQKGALNADAFGCFNFDFDFFHLGGLHFDGGNSKRGPPNHHPQKPAPTDGTCGTPDTAGSAGTAGTPGSVGTPGSAGTIGSPGITGTPGSPTKPGAAGTPGKNGTAGTPGVDGRPGTKGTPGHHGGPAPGGPGAGGHAGAPGAPGTPGAYGGAGASGSAGSAGAAGATGAAGDAGAPTSNAPPAGHGAPAKPTSCNAQTCEVLQKGGLANLNLVGCGKASAHAGP
ncbi:hypothetical protein A4X06_0g2619, partial [Tilletia controversa]